MGGDAKLAGKRAIVTGSGTGIGREIALEFAREGAQVVFHYCHSEAGAKSAVEQVQAAGGKAAAFAADFAELDQVWRFAQEAIEFLGGVEALVNNAGITFNQPFLEVTAAQFETLLNVNLRAQYFLTQRVAREMVDGGGGAICNITSIHGVQGAPEHSLYAATKGAIIAYTRVLGVELAHRGVRVNAIAPGAVPVESHRKAIPGYDEKAAAAAARETIPAGRAGTPLDIAKLAVFLCSDDAEFIVGQTIIADGGTTSLMSLMPDFRRRSGMQFGADYLK